MSEIEVGDGATPCQIAITGQGFVVIGEGEVQKVRKGKKRGKYKKVTPRMIYAAEVLTTFGFKPLELMELFGLARRTAYELAKKAKAEIERKMREYQEREREREKEQVTLDKKPEWQRGESAPRFQNVRRYRS